MGGFLKIFLYIKDGWQDKESYLNKGISLESNMT